MLLGAHSHHEGGNGHELLTNTDVSLSNHDAGVMHGGGEFALHDEGLESSLHELCDSQTKDVIEFALLFTEESESYHSADKGLAYLCQFINIFNIGHEKRLGGTYLRKFFFDHAHPRLVGFWQLFYEN